MKLKMLSFFHGWSEPLAETCQGVERCSSQNGTGQYFRVKRGSICIDFRVARGFHFLLWVNLAVAGFGCVRVFFARSEGRWRGVTHRRSS